MERALLGRLWWSTSLAVITGAIGGAVVSAADPGTGLQFGGVMIVVAGVTVFVVLGRRGTQWQRPHPFVRFMVFLFGYFLAAVPLARVATAVFGPFTLVGTVAELAAVLLGFAIALWLTFDDGADRLWVGFLRLTGIEW